MSEALFGRYRCENTGSVLFRAPYILKGCIVHVLSTTFRRAKMSGVIAERSTRHSLKFIFNPKVNKPDGDHRQGSTTPHLSALDFLETLGTSGVENLVQNLLPNFCFTTLKIALHMGQFFFETIKNKRSFLAEHPKVALVDTNFEDFVTFRDILKISHFLLCCCFSSIFVQF